MTNVPTIIGLDLGKNWFHLVGLVADGAAVLRRKLNRRQLAEFAATAPACVIAMEACSGSQYWGRVFTHAGHEVRILPAQFVRPYMQANKNDFHDAAAIAEAGTRARMRCVPLKTTEQLEVQALHRLRQRVVTERTALVNQMRGLLLEHGIVVPLGRDLLARRLPAVFAEAEQQLSPRLVALLRRLRQRWLAIDVEIHDVTRELTDWAAESAACRRLETVPGVGPLIATATVAAVGNGRMFRKGRDMAAWLGIVPSQHSAGGNAASRRDQQAREYVPATDSHSGRSIVLRPLETRPLRPGGVAPPGRGPSPAPSRRRRAGQQDGPDLLEGVNGRGGVLRLSDPCGVAPRPTIGLRGSLRRWPNRQSAHRQPD